MPLESVGTAIVVDLMRASEPGFFPSGSGDVESVVQAGDLVVLDEAYRFWGASEKIDNAHVVFFREHRHYVNEHGVACDLLFMTQDISDLNRKVKVVVELQCRFKKLKSLGLSSRYAVTVHDGHRIRRKPIRTLVRKYEKKYFPLYHSYVGGKGKELLVDKRQSVFSSPMLWIKMGLVVAGLTFVGYRFATKGIFGGLSPVRSHPGQPAPGHFAPVAKAGSGSASTLPPGPVYSSSWRVVGFTTQPGIGAEVYVVGSDNQVRVVPRSACDFSASPSLEVSKCTVDSSTSVTFAGPGLSSQSASDFAPGLGG